MQFELCFEKGLQEDLVAIERSLTFALDRFADSIQWVRVRGIDMNGAKGGIDKLCRLTAHLNSGELITVSDRKTAMAAAVAGVSEKAAVAIGRLLARKTKRRYTSSMSGQVRSPSGQGQNNAADELP